MGEVRSVSWPATRRATAENGELIVNPTLQVKETTGTVLLGISVTTHDADDVLSDGHGGTIVYDPPTSASTQTTIAPATVDKSVSQGGSSVITPAENSPSGTTVTATSTDQTLTGMGSNDTFVFGPGFGHDTITNFEPTTDVIEIDHSVFANVQALLAAMQDDGHGNVIINADMHDSITLQHVTVAQLQAHQYDFHII